MKRWKVLTSYHTACGWSVTLNCAHDYLHILISRFLLLLSLTLLLPNSRTSVIKDSSPSKIAESRPFILLKRVCLAQVQRGV